MRGGMTNQPPVLDRTDRWLAVCLGGNMQTGMLLLVVWLAVFAAALATLGSIIR